MCGCCMCGGFDRSLCGDKCHVVIEVSKGKGPSSVHPSAVSEVITLYLRLPLCPKLGRLLTSPYRDKT